MTDVDETRENLKALAEDASSLMGLACEVRERIETALERLGAPPAREAIEAYLRTVSNRELRRALIAARGAQGAAVLATKLNGDLAGLGKVRPSLNGRTRARAAGNGHAVHVDL